MVESTASTTLINILKDQKFTSTVSSVFQKNHK
jgi:hypothetical protein